MLNFHPAVGIGYQLVLPFELSSGDEISHRSLGFLKALGYFHDQKNDLRQADATRVRTDCIRPMRHVRPDRLLDVFSDPMRLVPPNPVIPPPMHPAPLLRPPSIPTPPSSFPSSTALV